MEPSKINIEPKCEPYGDLQGPFFHISIEINYCLLFSLNLKDASDRSNIKNAFRDKINDPNFSKSQKDLTLLNVAFELSKNKKFSSHLDSHTGVMKLVVKDDFPDLSHFLLVCGEFEHLFSLSDLGLIKYDQKKEEIPCIYRFKDSSQRSLLYLSSICNEQNYVKEILSWPIHIYDIPETGSTALHASAF